MFHSFALYICLFSMFQPPSVRWVFVKTTGPTRHCETTSVLVPRTGRWGHLLSIGLGLEWICSKDSSGMPCLTPDDAVHPCPGKPLVPRMWSGRASCGGAQQTPMELEFIFFITINKIAKDCWGCFVCLFFWYAFIYIYCDICVDIYLYMFHRWKFVSMRVCSLLSV